jgi:hypothetical protein
LDNIKDIRSKNIDEHSLVDWAAVEKAVDMSELG